MQMLQQIFGVEGARYVAWLITAVALIILALLLWWLIRKALGDRINMSDRADRRGRPPRLGVTESFNIGPQGRRLVMVRRDNVEHLIMIGGPNDVVIETNVIRGERPSVGRADSRLSEPDLPLAPLPPVPEPQPVLKVAAASALAAPAAPFAAPEVKAAPEFKAAPVAPPAPPPLAMRAPDPTPVVRAPEPQPAVVTRAGPPVLPPAEAAPPRSGFSLADRLKAGLSLGQASPKVPDSLPKVPDSLPKVPEAVAKATDAVKAETQKIADAVKVELPKLEVPKVEIPRIETPKIEIPRIETPVTPSTAEVKAMLEEAVKAKMPPLAPAAPVPPPPAPMPAPAMAAPSPPPPPVAVAPPPPPVAVAPPPPPVAVAPPKPPATSAPASKNPFDSLEEEMARLLGRAPEGKG
jgi:flagellar protein FliO/FliZ